MKKRSIMAIMTLLVLAFGANLALAMAANDPSGLPDSKSAPSVATPAQDVQPAPAMAAPPQTYPRDQVGPHYHGAQYYPGWGCGYYHPVSGNSYYGWGCGWGCW